MTTKPVIVVLWEWPPESKHAGARFWGCHNADNDGRLRDWPKLPLALIPRGAALAHVVEGEGLELVAKGAAP